jgi:ethanolamine permease
MGLGILALLTGRTAEIITVSVFGALTLYALAMFSLFRLRRDEPALPRPFRTPLYPVLPSVALALSLVCLAALAYANPTLALVYAGLLATAFAWFFAGVPSELRKPVPIPVKR